MTNLPLKFTEGSIQKIFCSDTIFLYFWYLQLSYFCIDPFSLKKTCYFRQIWYLTTNFFCIHPSQTKKFVALDKFGISEQIFYDINIASPKLKKRYLSFTASSYAAMTLSRPASAETNISSVDSGRWKFVMSASSILKR